MKLTSELAQALANLRGNRDFAVVLEALKENLKEETKRCCTHEGSSVLRAQGAVATVQWYLDSFDEAPSVLEKFKTKQPRVNT